MPAATPPAWNVFKQIFGEHWDGFKRAYPRYDRRYYDGLVHKMLACGDPEQMGYIEYRCLQCGEGTYRVALSWTRVRICAETYGFARQKTRGGSMNLILISWMSFLVDF